MTLDYRRVMEIWVPESGDRGTGYLLCDGCLLTALHVIENMGSSGIECRSLGQYEKDRQVWIQTKDLVWQNQSFDLAILKFATDSTSFPALPWIKTIEVNSEIACKAQGFPRFRKTKDKETGEDLFAPYLAEGSITWQGNPKQKGELLININGANPKEMKLWQGFSGAALFSDDGYLLGTVIQGPEELGGMQLDAIALETVLKEDPDLSLSLENKFNKELSSIPVHNPDADEQYQDHLELIRLRVKKSDLESEIVDLNHQYDGLREQFPSIGEHSLSSQKKLYQLLDYVERTKPEIVWNAWKTNPCKNTIKRSLTKFEEVYAILNDQNQLQNFHTFLAHIYADLKKTENQIQECLIPLRDLSQSILQIELEELELERIEREVQNLDPPPLLGAKRCWLILIEEKSQADQEEQEYEVTSWLIEDRQTYQNTLDEAGRPTHDSVKQITPIMSEEVFKLATKNSEAFQNDVTAKLSELLNRLWEDPSLAIESSQADVVFCIPKSLMRVEFDSIELGLFNTLGKDLSVSISILDRYKPSFAKYRRYWLERWNVLKTYCEEPIYSHVEMYDVHCSNPNSTLDLSCPRKLRDWLLRQDLDRKSGQKGKVVGFGSFAPCSEFHQYLLNLMVNGLSVMVWPHKALAEVATQRFAEALNEPKQSVANSIKEYRIRHLDDAGPLTLWIDDPYLPPPDPDVFSG